MIATQPPPLQPPSPSPVASPTPSLPFIGPVVVLEVSLQKARIATPNGQRDAQIALALQYSPSEGDRVLAAGRDDEWYVIGVLNGRGSSVIEAPGDLEITAPRGSLRLLAARGIEVSSPAFRIITSTLRFTAEKLTERYHSVSRWVTGCFHSAAGSAHAVVEEDYQLTATEIRQHAREEAHIEAETVHLS